MRILFVAEQFVPPVRNGSTLVYKAWLDALAERHEVFAILFTLEAGDTAEAEAFLKAKTVDFLILPGVPESRIWKSIRAASRYITGKLFAPRFIEEWGRTESAARIDAFLKRNPVDVSLFSKSLTVWLFGVEALRSLRGWKLLDMHDDFVERERLERHVLGDMLARYPRLTRHPPVARLKFRHALSRFSEMASRRQEAELFSLFDRVLMASTDEYEAYAARSGGYEAITRYLPWPLAAEPRPARIGGQFDVGMIASDAMFNIEGFLHFYEVILPKIQRSLPAVRCLVVGSIASALGRLRENWAGVELVPSVERVEEFYEGIRVALVPLLSGTGVSLKTLEALEQGRPVVALPRGARGIDAASFPGLLVAQSDTEFAELVVKQLQSGPRLLPHPSVERVSFRPDSLPRLDAVIAELEGQAASSPAEAGAISLADRGTGRKSPRITVGSAR